MEKIIDSHTECPDVDVLYRYKLGTLPREEARKIEEHLLDCEICNDILEGMEYISQEELKEIAERVSKKIDATIVKHKRNKKIKKIFFYSLSFAAIFLIFLGIKVFFAGKNTDSQQVIDERAKKKFDSTENFPVKDSSWNIKIKIYEENPVASFDSGVKDVFHEKNESLVVGKQDSLILEELHKSIYVVEIDTNTYSVRIKFSSNNFNSNDFDSLLDKIEKIYSSLRKGKLNQTENSSLVCLRAIFFFKKVHENSQNKSQNLQNEFDNLIREREKLQELLADLQHKVNNLKEKLGLKSNMDVEKEIKKVVHRDFQRIANDKTHPFNKEAAEYLVILKKDFL